MLTKSRMRHAIKSDAVYDYGRMNADCIKRLMDAFSERSINESHELMVLWL